VSQSNAIVLLVFATLAGCSSAEHTDTDIRTSIANVVGAGSAAVVGATSCPGVQAGPSCPPLDGGSATSGGCTQTWVSQATTTSCTCVAGDAGAAWSCTTTETLQSNGPGPTVCEAAGGQCLLPPSDGCAHVSSLTCEPNNPGGLFCCLDHQ
jgi:hypothetical protein